MNFNRGKRSLAIAFDRLNIQQKISSGYALALSIAVLGTTAAIVYSNYSQEQAETQLDRISQEERLLDKLQYYVLEANSDQLQLIPAIEQATIFAEEEEDLNKNLSGMKALFAELKSAVDSHFNNTEEDVEDLEKFVDNYQETVDTYIQQIEVILEKIQSNKKSLNSPNIKTIEQSLIKFNRGETARKFDNLSNELDQLVEVARQERKEAQLSLQQAISTGNLIIISSLGVSIAIAVLLALATSQAIARPIKTVTKVAQQVTEEANFNLQVPINTKDEIGILAVAFNNLIQRVAQNTQELEIARQTLEERVQERTEQLFTKNEELELAQQNLQQLNTNLLAQTHSLNQALQDLQQTQSQLIQSEKMSSLGQMVAGIAHEINNPVNFIHGNIEHISNYAQDLLALVDLYQQDITSADIQSKIEEIDLEYLIDDMPKLLSSIQSGTDRIRQIVLSLRNFSRLDEAEMKKVDIHEGIDNTLLILNYRLKQDIEVIKKYSELPLVQCYPAQLNQVFMNILSNAIDALSEQKEPNRKELIISTENSNTNQIHIRISDNGTGISEEIKGKIFDPFFTTKPIGKGTGLGLSICYQIIEKHGGKIELTSALGQGTEFAIALPIKSKSSDY